VYNICLEGLHNKKYEDADKSRCILLVQICHNYNRSITITHTKKVFQTKVADFDYICIIIPGLNFKMMSNV
jgi:hypothetical protein